MTVKTCRSARRRILSRSPPPRPATSITATTFAACRLFARFDSASGEGVTTAYDGFGRLRTSSTNMGGTTRTLSYII